MTGRAVRVLLVSPLPPPRGGIARWTELVSRHLAERNDVRIRILNTAVRLRTPQSASMPVRLVTGSLEALWTVARVIAGTIRCSPDVTHINSSGQFGLLRDLVVASWCRWRRLPVVLHIRFGRVPEMLANRTLEWKLLSTVVQLSTATIAIDARTAYCLRRSCPATPVVLIPNCVETAYMGVPQERSDHDVVFAGSLIPTKGVDELLRAWSRIPGSGLRLHLLGKPDKAYLGELRTKGLIDRRTHIRGEVDHREVLESLRTCAVFVLPSHTEGFPNVVVEAMAEGAPVIATPVGAVPDMLAYGAGVTVPVGDVEALTGALRDMLSDATRRSALGARARRRAHAEYAVGSISEEYVRIWKAVALGCADDSET